MLGFGGWPLCSELDVFLHGKQEVLAAATPNLAGRTRQRKTRRETAESAETSEQRAPSRS